MKKFIIICISILLFSCKTETIIEQPKQTITINELSVNVGMSKEKIMTLLIKKEHLKGKISILFFVVTFIMFVFSFWYGNKHKYKEECNWQNYMVLSVLFFCISFFYFAAFGYHSLSNPENEAMDNLIRYYLTK